MIPLEEAVDACLALFRPLAVAPVPLADALGLVAAEAVAATEAVPSFANSAMDGYAVRAADTTDAPVALAVVGSLAAGAGTGPAVGPGQAVRIMTGAPLPLGADAVCMVERTGPGGPGQVVVEETVVPGTNVRRPGEDVAPGDRLVGAGDRLTAARLALLAGQGLAAVAARRRPVVGVLSTGRELDDGPGPLRPGAIRDTNRPLLLGLVAAAGAVPVDLGVVTDDQDALTAALLAAPRDCDAVCTTGGVSVGDFDYVKVVLDRLCPDLRAVQVAVKPSKPLAFGRLGESATPVIGLPGNPVSAAVGFELFVRPGLRRMAGEAGRRPATVTALAAAPVGRRPDGKTHLVRVVAAVGPDAVLRVAPVDGQGSHQLRALAEATALAVLPDGPGVGAGEPVAVLLTEPEALPPASAP